MRSVLISIGDELLIGQVINTNASFLGEKLLAAGIPPEKIITISDDKKEILDTFRYAFDNYDIIIVTGGLGPTHDDITKICISEFFNTGLVSHEKTLANIKSIYKRRKIKMPDTAYMQAMVPKVCKVLLNKAGTAPGMLFEKKGKLFVSLPGVPHELHYIWEKHLEKIINDRKKLKEEITVKTIHTIGIPESMLAKKLGSIEELNKKFPQAKISLAFLPSNFEVRLRLTIRAATKKKTQSVMRSCIQLFKARAGEYIYSYKAEPQGKVIGDLLKELDMKLATAESCTGGMIASKITDFGGSSNYFSEGAITYSNESKKKLLGVKQKSLTSFGAVSEKVAEEMALGIRNKSGSDIGISATGIAGPGGATAKKPVGLVWIGYSDKDVTFAKKFIFTKDRIRNKDIMAKMALETLRKELLRIKDDRNKKS